MTRHGLLRCLAIEWSLVVIAVIAVIASLVSGDQRPTLRRVCYLRPDSLLPVATVVRLDLCTHIIVGFSAVDSTAELTHDQQFVRFCEHCRRTIDRNGAHTKLMFSIGGIVQVAKVSGVTGALSDRVSSPTVCLLTVGGLELATSTDSHRKRFIASIIRMIHTCQLDGVDIDWEFPSWGHNFSHRFARDNFIYLLKEIRAEFDRYRMTTGKALLLSTAVAAQITIINVSYRPKEIAKHVDFINLMAYDFYIHKWYWPFIGHNSALHARSVDIGLKTTFNTEWSANYWHLLGVPKRQIMVGIPVYGKRFTLYSKYLNYPGALAVSNNADCTYSDVCDFLNLNDTVQKFDDQARVPYAFNGYDWISYENEQSAALKAHWIKRNAFGGAMLFSLNVDDFRYRCSEQPFPIHRTVRNVFTDTDP